MLVCALLAGAFALRAAEGAGALPPHEPRSAAAIRSAGATKCFCIVGDSGTGNCLPNDDTQKRPPKSHDSGGRLLFDFSARSLGAGVALDALVGGRHGLELALLDDLIVTTVAVAVICLLV